MSLLRKRVLVGIGVSLLAGQVLAQRNESPNQWYADGVAELRHSLQLEPNKSRAKNVILFIGDGMGISTVTAARIFAGQLRGDTGEENVLSFEAMPYLALAKTYNTDQQVPDAAGSMTAIMTGIKTKAGLIGLNQNAQRGNCRSAQGTSIQSFLELAAKSGMSAGIVTTARVTNATTAATYAHSADRDWESDHDMSASALKQGCKDIARQLLDFPFGGGLDVVLGGGRGKFLPNTATDPEDSTQTGERDDKRDLTAEWTKKYRNAVYVWNEKQFAAVNPGKVDHLLGLFNRSDMNFEVDRKDDAGGEPSLTEMTRKAIAVLQKNSKGFFLMVEDSRIDQAHRMGNAYRALDETREFANAVQAALRATSSKDTLIIVTADHGHALTISGAPKRGNPILGKVVENGVDGKPDQLALGLDERPYTTLGYMNGPGAVAVRDPTSKEFVRRDLTETDTTRPDYLQQALVPLARAANSGEDVPIYASGPWAQLFHRTVEQNYIYQVMRYAALESPKPRERKSASGTKRNSRK